MQSDTKLSLATGVHVESLGEGEDAVVLSMQSGHLYRCNHTGAVVLELLSQGATCEQVIQQVSTRYRVDSERVRADLVPLIENLLAERIVDRAA